MRLIGKLLALPFMLVTGILYLVCKFLVVLSYMQRHQSCGRYFRHLLNLIPIREVIIAEKERGCLCAPPNLLNQI